MQSKQFLGLSVTELIPHKNHKHFSDTINTITDIHINKHSNKGYYYITNTFLSQSIQIAILNTVWTVIGADPSQYTDCTQSAWYRHMKDHRLPRDAHPTQVLFFSLSVLNLNGQCYDHEFVIMSSIVYHHGCVPIGRSEQWHHLVTFGYNDVTVIAHNVKLWSWLNVYEKISLILTQLCKFTFTQ